MADAMSTLLKRLACALVLLGAAGLGRAADADANLIERGRYLAVAGDCAACHTAAGKAPFSGGVAIASPLGTIYSTNITPSRAHGIGAWTQQQFARALRAGVRADGSHLYPAMPYTAYARITDDDTAALYAYFMHGVRADDTSPPRTELPFPFSVRMSMGIWNWLYLDGKPFEADTTRSAEWNRGAYLAQGLAHCATCHTPRNFLMAEQSSRYLQGASLGTWYAPDIRPGKPGWDRAMLVEYLRTGHARNGATAGGPMLEAIDKSFSKMAPEDIAAIATYLNDLPPGQRATAPPSAAVAVVAPLPRGDVEALAGRIGAGERLYRNNCASCHQADGDGVRGLPALRNHAVLRTPSADNVAMAVLEGVWPEDGQGMPGFAGELSDQEVADIGNYVMATFGGSKVAIDAARVRELRAGGAVSPLLLLARVGMVAAALALAVVVWQWLRRRKRRAGIPR
ncbi:cytochrome c [Massilia sp. TN1-12]|uniref:cytochrome c n=1 Tax=Massilia paldalensis TaxID=3377675 RepID=UPI00384EE3B2